MGQRPGAANPLLNGGGWCLQPFWMQRAELHRLAAPRAGLAGYEGLAIVARAMAQAGVGGFHYVYVCICTLCVCACGLVHPAVAVFQLRFVFEKLVGPVEGECTINAP